MYRFTTQNAGNINYNTCPAAHRDRSCPLFAFQQYLCDFCTVTDWKTCIPNTLSAIGQTICSSTNTHHWFRQGWMMFSAVSKWLLGESNGKTIWDTIWRFTFSFINYTHSLRIRMKLTSAYSRDQDLYTSRCKINLCTLFSSDRPKLREMMPWSAL